MRSPILYGVQPDGGLTWHRHDGWQDGSFTWAADSGKKIGDGWDDFSMVFSGGDGIIYGIQKEFLDPTTGRTTGRNLVWFRDDGRFDGRSALAAAAGKVVGYRWDGFSRVFSGGDGVIYGIQKRSFDPTTGRPTGGNLLWYRHEGRGDGSFAWAPGSGTVIARGWHAFTHAFATGAGVIYAVREDGDLLWHRHDGRGDGAPAWAPGSGKTVGAYWDSYSAVFSGGEGVIYAIEKGGLDPTTGRHTGGRLLWTRHDGWRDGGPAWFGPPARVGRDWDGLANVFANGDSRGTTYTGAGRTPYVVGGAILTRYQQLGETQSWLGWPTSDEEPFDQDGRVQTFENGSIYWWLDTGAIELGNVAVNYTGLACFGETDDDQLSSADEPYLWFGVVPRVTDLAKTVRTPIYEYVDAGDSRADAIELYKGPPFGLMLRTDLWEHDFSNPDHYKSTVQAGVEAGKAAITAAVAAIPGIGPFLAVGAGALLSAIGPAIADAVNEIFDTEDDHVGHVDFVVTPKDMVTQTRAGLKDFRGIRWHLDSPLLSGQGASYKAYIEIRPA
jgi:tachylectin/LGFP repeat-containing protein